MKRTAGSACRAVQQGKPHLIIASLLMLLLLLCQAAAAQQAPVDSSSKPLKLPADVKKYLQDKYKDKDGKDQIERISSSLQETPNGPGGNLQFSGHIKPKNLKLTSSDKVERTRAVAKAFLQEEAVLLGLPDIGDLREYDMITLMEQDRQFTQIQYERYIENIPFKSGTIRIEIGPDESISAVTISLVPVPPELYKALKRPTITKEDALKIVGQDLTRRGSYPEHMTVLHARKIANPVSPYVFWQMDIYVKYTIGRWKYIINAFTGEILRKTDAIMVD